MKPGYWRRYRPKECPTCHVIHRNQGRFCSITCANRNRKHSEEHKAKTSKTLLEYFRNSPEGIAVRQKIANKNRGIPRIKQEDIDISLPELYDPEFDF